MLSYITILLACQLVGEVVVRLSGAPVPGPVVGMLLLFIGLVVRGRVPEGLEKAAGGLLSNLSLLFIPAGVGVVVHVPLIMSEWLPISVSLVGSTLLTIAVTGLVMKALSGRRTEGAGS